VKVVVILGVIWRVRAAIPEHNIFCYILNSLGKFGFQV